MTRRNCRRAGWKLASNNIREVVALSPIFTSAQPKPTLTPRCYRRPASKLEGSAEGRKEFQMSASLIVMVPIVLLGLVTALCFVGCGLMTHGLGLGFGPYEDPISNNSNCVACWPLNDAPPSTTAVDIKGGLNGSYMGSVALVQTGIVAGDFQN